MECKFGLLRCGVLLILLLVGAGCSSDGGEESRTVASNVRVSTWNTLTVTFAEDGFQLVSGAMEAQGITPRAISDDAWHVGKSDSTLGWWETYVGEISISTNSLPVGTVTPFLVERVARSFGCSDLQQGKLRWSLKQPVVEGMLNCYRFAFQGEFAYYDVVIFQLPSEKWFYRAHRVSLENVNERAMDDYVELAINRL